MVPVEDSTDEIMVPVDVVTRKGCDDATTKLSVILSPFTVPVPLSWPSQTTGFDGDKATVKVLPVTEPEAFPVVPGIAKVPEKADPDCERVKVASVVPWGPPTIPFQTPWTLATAAGVV